MPDSGFESHAGRRHSSLSGEQHNTTFSQVANSTHLEPKVATDFVPLQVVNPGVTRLTVALSPSTPSCGPGGECCAVSTSLLTKVVPSNAMEGYILWQNFHLSPDRLMPDRGFESHAGRRHSSLSGEQHNTTFSRLANSTHLKLKVTADFVPLKYLH